MMKLMFQPNLLYFLGGCSNKKFYKNVFMAQKGIKCKPYLLLCTHIKCQCDTRIKMLDLLKKIVKDEIKKPAN